MVEHHLEQRVMAQAALGLQHLHELLERQVLMGLRLQGTLLDLGQQLVERHLPVHVSLQHLGVDEKAQQSLGFEAITVGDRYADTHLCLAAVAVQQGLERGQQQHEQRHVLTLGQGLEFSQQRTLQMNLAARATMALHCGAWIVQRQVQQRMFVPQTSAPVIELALLFPSRHPVALPLGVVGVLDRQGRQPCVALVQRHPLVDHHLHRPAVRDDVVLGDDQHMVIRRDDQQLDAHQRAVAQVERALDLFGDSLLDSAGVDLLLFNRHCQAWVDDLHGVLARLHKGGTQRFMALHQGLDGALQRRDVEFTAQVQGGGHMIGRAGGIQLPEKPLPLLGKGQRQRLLTANRLHHGRGIGLHACARRCESGQRRLFEQGPQRHFQLEIVAHPGDHLGGQQGVAAAFEEVIFQANLLDLQHCLPDRRQLDLQWTLRRHVGGAGLVQVGCGQRTAVELAVVVQRQGIEDHPMARHHVVRQRLAQARRQCLGLQRLAFGWHHVRHQLHAGRARLRKHGGFSHVGQGLQAGFDFAHFDTQATNLHLMVDTPDVLQRTRRVVPGQVATAIKPRTGHGGKRVRQEALGGQRRAVEIALRQANLGTNAQLAHAIGGQQFETAVEYIQAAPGNRLPDWHAVGVVGIGQLALMHAGDHRGFGRPVGVDQAHIAQARGVPRTHALH